MVWFVGACNHRLNLVESQSLVPNTPHFVNVVWTVQKFAMQLAKAAEENKTREP